MAQTVSLLLSAPGRAALCSVIEDRGRPVKHVQRAQIVLLSADHLRFWRSPSGSASAGRWCGAGSSATPKRGWTACCATRPARPASRDTEGQGPCRGRAHASRAAWRGDPLTGRAMAEAMGLSLRTIQRIWTAHKLQPHRIKDVQVLDPIPTSRPRLDDVVGLYMNPPRHAVVLSIDEKSQIQRSIAPARACL